MPQVIKKQYYPGDLARRHAERSAKILNRTDAVKTPPPVSNDNALKVGDTTPDGMLCVKIDAKNNKALLRSDFTGDIDYETARKQAEGSVNGNPAGACRLPGMDELRASIILQLHILLWLHASIMRSSSRRRDFSCLIRLSTAAKCSRAMSSTLRHGSLRLTDMASNS